MAQVNYIRVEVQDLLSRWTLVKDCVAGSEEVKKKGITYLPKPNAANTSPENTARYSLYKDRAVFYNVTSRTLRGLVGMVFNRKSTLVLPPLMEHLEDNLDGASIGIDQQAKKALGHTLSYGRAGLLTDYPNVEGTTTRAQQIAGSITPTVLLYEPWDIINWRVTTVNGKKLLSLVVIAENYTVNDDGFEEETRACWRVLQLIDGKYTVTIYEEVLDDQGKSNGSFVVKEGPYQPQDSTGAPFTEIPFTFIGSENNDPVPDLPPMYDMSILNMAHYRNSADYEESCYMVGQPTPYFAGLTEDWVKDVLKGEIMLGSRTAVPLPDGGTAGLLQAEPNTMPFEAMGHKEKQMVALGAKLVEDKEVQRTAKEATMDKASETSILSSSAENVAEAYQRALDWAAMFTGADPETIEYELNTDFDTNQMSPEQRKQLMAEWMGNAISDTEMRAALKKGGIATQDDEEAAEEIANSTMNPMNVGTDLTDETPPSNDDT